MLAGPAAALAHTYDFAAHRRLLDVGGGTGSWSIAAVRAHPGSAATVVELPVVAAVAKTRVAEAGLGDRIEVVTGDAMGGDAAGRARRRAGGQPRALLVAGAEPAAPAPDPRPRRAPDARLLLADFWTDPTHTRPTHAALMAGEFAVHLENGDVYSVDEVRGWLGETGWRFVEHRALAGPQSLVVATADQR